MEKVWGRVFWGVSIACAKALKQEVARLSKAQLFPGSGALRSSPIHYGLFGDPPALCWFFLRIPGW